MSRKFEASQYWRRTTAVASITPLTFSSWFWPVSTSINAVLMCISDNAPVAQNLIEMRHITTNTRAFVLGSGNNAATTAANNVIGAQWNHAAAVFASDTSRFAYSNGVVSAEATASSTASGLNTTIIGARGISTPDQLYNGYIGESAIWQAALTSAEITALYRGVPPYLIRPTALVAYWPMKGPGMGLEYDFQGRYPLTVSGTSVLTPLDFDYPKRILPMRQWARSPLGKKFILSMP